MKIRESQSFLSIYYGSDLSIYATGEIDPHLDAETWNRETRELGQVATPPAVAALMARWVMSALPATVLDPAVGLGGLLHECRRLDKGVRLVGVERDEMTLGRAKHAAPCGTQLILADYLTSNRGQFGGIVANPPYVKAQRLTYTESDWRYFEERFGTPLDRLTNLYALFLLKIWEDLKPGGHAAVILPSEFLNANFGEEIKDRLLRALRPAGLIIFSPSLNLFAQTLTTSALILLEKGRPTQAPIAAIKVDCLEEAESFIMDLLGKDAVAPETPHTDLSRFDPCEKWLNIFFNAPKLNHQHGPQRRVGDYFACRRGIATGSNEYFCLSETNLHEHGLNGAHVEPCVTKAVDADGLLFTEEKFDALARANRRCYLLNPRQMTPKMEMYLRHGERLGIPQRHLPSHRPVWYRPENRDIAQVWVAVFSRDNVKFILNTSRAKNLTCFHGLYARPGKEDLAPLLTLFLNSSLGRDSFKQVNRFYGGGLNKLEPRDVEAMPCPELPVLGSVQAEELVHLLARLETLPLTERRHEVDKEVFRRLNLSV